jgi:hypothetical protein
MHDYPLDSLLIRNETRTVHDICRRIEQGNYIMDPDFQRDFIWDAEKQSRLIESLLMRIPLPVFYMAERYDGKVIVIDGLQRLTTISRYLNNDFSLHYLNIANDLFTNNKFNDLPVKLQNRLEDTQLIIYILDEKVPERARLDIFERVNGGVPLSRQQMRNCLYCGPATIMLRELANDQRFLTATGESLNKQFMRDREFINRYMAFEILGKEQYRGDMDEFLAIVLQEINQRRFTEIDEMKTKFLNSMDNCFNIWGKHTFRKHNPNQNHRSVINAALFDVLSTTIGNLPYQYIKKYEENFRYGLQDLLDDEEFLDSITLSTNSLRNVRTRFEKIEELIKGVTYD